MPRFRATVYYPFVLASDYNLERPARMEIIEKEARDEESFKEICRGYTSIGYGQFVEFGPISRK